MNSVNLVSYNVHGLNHPIKRKKILAQLKQLHCSIAMLTETHLTNDESQKLKRGWVGKVFHASHGKKRGVAILISKNLPFTEEKVVTDDKGRYIMVVGSIGEMFISIVNVYAPNEEDGSIFKQIAGVIAKDGKGMIVWGGRFQHYSKWKIRSATPGKGTQ